MKQKLFRGLYQYGQYSVIGITCGIIDIGSLNLFLLLCPTDQGLWLAVFNTIAYSLAVFNSYIWNSRITFRRGFEKNRRQKINFVLQAGFSLIISNVTLLLAVFALKWFDFMTLWMVHNLGKGISMFFSSTASFFFMKFFVFHKIHWKQKFAE